jgi:general secretion pathway protein D
LKVGDTFTAQLGIQADQAISGLPLSIGFDARSLQALSVVEGDFLKQGGAVTNFVNNIDPAGQIQITATRTGEVGAIGSGTFAALNFKVIAAPVSITRIQVLSVSPAGIGGRAISAPLPLPQEILLSQP